MGRMFAIVGADRCGDIAGLLMSLSDGVGEDLDCVHGLAYWQTKEYVFRRMPSESRRRLALTAIAPPPMTPPSAPSIRAKASKPTCLPRRSITRCM